MRIIAVALAALALHCSPEQHALPVPQTTAPKGPVLPSQDRDFLEQAVQGNNAEIAIGGLVTARASRPEVLQFGQRMVTDHRSANAKLGEVARQLGIHSLTTSLGDHQAAYDNLLDRKGDPFDREFMKTMIADHHQAALLFQGEATNGADPRLRQYAATTLPIIQAHLADAQSLAAPTAETIMLSRNAPTP